jgi:hypothetical protein
MPIPGLLAYEAGHLATSQKKNADASKTIYKDARAVFQELFSSKIKNLPGPT